MMNMLIIWEDIKSLPFEIDIVNFFIEAKVVAKFSIYFLVFKKKYVYRYTVGETKIRIRLT